MDDDRAFRDDQTNQVLASTDAAALLAAVVQALLAAAARHKEKPQLEGPLPEGWRAIERQIVDAVAAASKAGRDRLLQAATRAASLQYRPAGAPVDRTPPNGPLAALLGGVAAVARAAGVTRRLVLADFATWDPLYQDAYADAQANLLAVCQDDQDHLIDRVVAPTLHGLLAEVAARTEQVPDEAWVAALTAAAVQRWNRLNNAYCWRIGRNAAVDLFRDRSAPILIEEPLHDEAGNILFDDAGKIRYRQTRVYRSVESLAQLDDATNEHAESDQLAALRGQIGAARFASPEQAQQRAELYDLVLDLLKALPDENDAPYRRVVALDTVLREFDTLEKGLPLPTARSWITTRIAEAFLEEYALPDHAERRVDEQIARLLFPADCGTDTDSETEQAAKLYRAANRVRTLKRWGMERLRVLADLQEWRDLLQDLLGQPTFDRTHLHLLAAYMRDLDTASSAAWLPETKPNRRAELRAPLILALLEQTPEGPIGRGDQGPRLYEQRLARAFFAQVHADDHTAAQQQVRDSLRAIREQFAALYTLAALYEGLTNRLTWLENTTARPHRKVLTMTLDLMERAAPRAGSALRARQVLMLVGSGDIQPPELEYAFAQDVGAVLGPVDATTDDAEAWARRTLRGAREELRAHARRLLER